MYQMDGKYSPKKQVCFWASQARESTNATQDNNNVNRKEQAKEKKKKERKYRLVSEEMKK